jgi:hypothetical protein
MSEYAATQALVLPGISCALCTDRYEPAVHFPVLTPEGQARMPRVCRNCLSMILKVSFQMLGAAGQQAAEVVVSMHATGHPPVTT